MDIVANNIQFDTISFQPSKGLIEFWKDNKVVATIDTSRAINPIDTMTIVGVVGVLCPK